MGGPQFGEVGDQLLGHRGHRFRLVPEVRIGGRVGQAEQFLDVDHLPRRGVDEADSIFSMKLS